MGDRQRKRKLQENLAPDSKLLKDNVRGYKYNDLFILIQEKSCSLSTVVFQHKKHKSVFSLGESQ